MFFVLFQPVHIPLFRRRVFCSRAAVVWKQLGVEIEGVPAKQFIVAEGRRGLLHCACMGTSGVAMLLYMW